MVKPQEKTTMINVFIAVVGVLLVVGGYILIGIMSILPSGDNTTKALVLLSILVIISSIAQLASLSIVSSRENKR